MKNYNSWGNSELIAKISELEKEVTKLKGLPVIKIVTPHDVFKHIKNQKLGNADFVIIFMDDKNHITETKSTFKELVKDKSGVVSYAIAKGYASFIVVRLSKDINPEPYDIATAEDLAIKGIKANVPMIDYVIVNDDNYQSLKSFNIFNTYKID